ncbi:MAG: hypothetical protein ACFHXK_12345 [bacterium]
MTKSLNAANALGKPGPAGNYNRNPFLTEGNLGESLCGALSGLDMIEDTLSETDGRLFVVRAVKLAVGYVLEELDSVSSQSPTAITKVSQ